MGKKKTQTGETNQVGKDDRETEGHERRGVDSALRGVMEKGGWGKGKEKKVEEEGEQKGGVDGERERGHKRKRQSERD